MNAADLLSKFRRMPYLIGVCKMRGCNRPAKFIEKGPPFKKLCERHMQMLCAGADVSEKLATSLEKEFDLNSVGETTNDGPAVGSGDTDREPGE